MAGSSELEAMFMGGGDDGDDNREEGYDETEMTAKMVLDELQEAWSNEKLCPELLPHKSELIDVMMEQVEQMEQNIKQLSRLDLRSMIHRQELERIKYLMKSYLRTRLEKVETYCLYFLRAVQFHQESGHQDSGLSAQPPGLDDPSTILSEQEMRYMREYAANTAAHLKVVLDHLPFPLNQFKAKEMETEPDLESHVFCRSKVDLRESLVVEGSTSDSSAEEEVHLRRGSQHVLPYKTVRSLVRASTVILI